MSLTQPSDPRIEKLPQWAQRRIAKLEADLAGARADLAAGPESDTFADPYSDSPRPLGIGTLVRFMLPGEARDRGRYIDARLQDDVLTIRADRALTVRPSSSNVIHVEARGA